MVARSRNALSILVTAIVVGVVFMAAPDLTNAQTSTLDAPVSIKPTVRSEIKRGEATAFDCGLHNLDYPAFTNCVSAIAAYNQQKNTKSDPFILGLSISALAQAKTINAGQDSGWISLWRKDTVRIMKSYKLTDAELCAAFDMKCEVVKETISEAK
jgi:hypothetical protein